MAREVRADRLLKRFAAAVGFCLPSCLTRVLFRLVGHRVGRNTRLPVFTYIFAEHVELGNDVDIRHFVFVSLKTVVIGNNTILSFGTQVTGKKGFETGDNCFVGAHTIIHCDENVGFGFYSGVGPHSMIYTHGSFLPATLGYPVAFAEVILEDFVWSAMRVSFLPGAHVERNCIINPGVVVSGRVPANTRLQMSKESVTRFDNNKLLRFAHRTPAYYHQSIIRSFLETEGMACEECEKGTLFRSKDGLEFRSIPDANQIELWCNGSKSVTYDLDGFYADESNLAIHQTFLTYVRRHYGLTLRTKYRGGGVR